MKIQDEPEEEKNIITSKSVLMERILNVERHEVLFSPETSQQYSSNRPEAIFSYDYEINNLRFGEEKEREHMY
jgi:hypothetical protein